MTSLRGADNSERLLRARMANVMLKSQPGRPSHNGNDRRQPKAAPTQCELTRWEGLGRLSTGRRLCWKRAQQLRAIFRQNSFRSALLRFPPARASHRPGGCQKLLPIRPKSPRKPHWNARSPLRQRASQFCWRWPLLCESWDLRGQGLIPSQSRGLLPRSDPDKMPRETRPPLTVGHLHLRNAAAWSIGSKALHQPASDPSSRSHRSHHERHEDTSRPRRRPLDECPAKQNHGFVEGNGCKSCSETNRNGRSQLIDAPP